MFNPDALTIAVQCPNCRFCNDVSLKEVRLRDVRLCRGCHRLIRFEDDMNTVRKSVRDIRAGLRQLTDQLSKTIEIDLTL